MMPLDNPTSYSFGNYLFSERSLAHKLEDLASISKGTHWIKSDLSLGTFTPLKRIFWTIAKIFRCLKLFFSAPSLKQMSHDLNQLKEQISKRGSQKIKSLFDRAMKRYHTLFPQKSENTFKAPYFTQLIGKIQKGEEHPSDNMILNRVLKELGVDEEGNKQPQSSFSYASNKALELLEMKDVKIYAPWDAENELKDNKEVIALVTFTSLRPSIWLKSENHHFYKIPTTSSTIGNETKIESVIRAFNKNEIERLYIVERVSQKLAILSKTLFPHNSSCLELCTHLFAALQ